MKNSPNIIRYLARLILATLVGLLTGGAPALAPVVQAQSVPANPSWTLTGSLNGNRYRHTATLLPNSKVLVVGGMDFDCPSFCYYGVDTSAELYDPATGTWSFAGSLTIGRYSHTATLLPNGQVLVAGGVTRSNPRDYRAYPVGTAQLYDPVLGSWRSTGSFNNTGARYSSATLLPNGKVLAVGNQYPPNPSAELYDPATGTWSITGAPAGDGIATLLANGKVLLLGWNSAELYDPGTETWSNTTKPDLNVAGAATTLRNGKILVTGTDVSTFVPRAELFDPVTETWSSTGNPHLINSGATLLSDGRVLLEGGYPGNGFDEAIVDAELYDPATGVFISTIPLNTARTGHTATLMANGKVLVVGGADGDSEIYSIYSSAEVFDPGSSLIPNQIDEAQFFVRQHYRDFLNRDPDPDGLAFWTNEIAACGGEAGCVEAKRVNVSAAYFLSVEFQETGYLVYRIYKASFGNLPDAPVPLRLNEFLPDTQKIGHDVIVNQTGWQQMLESNKQAFTAEFVQRARFTAAFPAHMTEADFVDKLNDNAGKPLSQMERDQLVSELAAGAKTRAQVLRAVAENQNLAQTEFNRAFVLMQYFGYLRRNPNDAPEPGLNYNGYNFWLSKLDSFDGNFVEAEMVKSFLVAAEYRQRFTP